ncbi:MAG: ribonuclease H, partial [Epulopiscium sp. Nele67-Bin002]
YKGVVKELSGGDVNTTNNKMELKAVIRALEVLTKYDIPVRIHVDSSYVLNGITSWINGWRRNGWKDSKKQPIKNQELWQQLYSLKTKFKDIEFIKVKGHSTNEGNNRADELCNLEMDKMGSYNWK